MPIEKSLSSELHRPYRKHFPTRRVIVPNIDDTWTADLFFMPKKIKLGETEGVEEPQPGPSQRLTASEKQIENLNNFLAILDVFSRYAWVVQIPNKKSVTVAKEFLKIFKDSGRKPKKIWTDRGGEFTGLIDRSKDKKPVVVTDFQCEDCGQYFKTKAPLTNHRKNQCPVLYPEKAKEDQVSLPGDIILYHTEGTNKATIAERFIKTIKDKIGRWMTDNKTLEYIPHLPVLVSEYNNTPHRNFKDEYSPKEASEKKNEEKIFEKYYKNAKPKPGTVDYITQKDNIEVEDRVRTTREKKKMGLEKSFTPTWTKEIFIVVKVKDTEPTTYYLKDGKDHHIDGAFYRQELQKTEYPIEEWMGHTKKRKKEDVKLGMEAVQAEATRQKEKKQRQRDREKEEKKKKETSGSGLKSPSSLVSKLPYTSLSNFELSDVCKNFKGWRGVFSRDTLPKKPNTRECGILNLDDSEGPGTHWVCWFKNKKNKFYFDSYGLQPPLEMRKYLKSPILYSSDQIQKPGTVICGHLCVFVLEKLNEGYDLQPVISRLLDLKEKEL